MNFYSFNNTMMDFIILGAVVGVAGHFVFDILRGKLPWIFSMLPTAAAGAVLGAMLFIFQSGTSFG
ncbi:MAG: hypothetical protein AAGJ28_08625 [Pseudomonadota bacterium]